VNAEIVRWTALGPGLGRSLQTSGCDRALQTRGCDRALQTRGCDRALQTRGRMHRGGARGYAGRVSGSLVEMARRAAPAIAISEALEPALAKALADAEAAGLAVDRARLIGAIAARLGEEPAAALAAMHVADLALACGCADGDAAALAAFEQRCGPLIERALIASGVSEAERADLGQVVRQRLLVAPADGRAPRIATYSARGSLPSWVRVVATREAARMLPKARREVAADDDALAGLIAGDDDPEIGYLKRLYRDELKRAFHAAIDALDDRARLLLRQHALDGLDLDQLAALHGAHRATIARWLAAARAAVLAATQRELIARLRLSRTELASVMRLIGSRLDVSLPRALGGSGR
jgi:RNA polymerase sigma-70 factor (ECF subfamily)